MFRIGTGARRLGKTVAYAAWNLSQTQRSDEKPATKSPEWLQARGLSATSLTPLPAVS